MDRKTIIEGQSEFSSRVGMFRPKFNATQNRIADFLLADEQAVLDMSIYEMAEKIGTSVATVTRFCQFIGYSGLADMKFHMQQQAVALEKDIGITRSDSVNVIKQKMMQFSENALHNCLMNLDNEALEKAIDLVGNAKRIMLTASGSAGGVAKTAVGLFMNMGFNAFTVEDQLLQLRTAANLGKDDILIAISYDGRAKSTGDAMMLAQNAGAKVILVTSLTDSLLARYADILLLTQARAAGNAMNITATSLCQLSILQLLMVGAVTRYYDRFNSKSRLQLKLSDMDRYDMKQKEITMSAARSGGDQ